MMQNVITYFGGKNAVADKILRYFPAESSFQIYIEPFGGSAGILLNKIPSKIEIYNDVDANVYSLYKVLSDWALMKKFKERADLSIFHDRLRKEYTEKLKAELSLEDRAFYFWYVNRTTRNGVFNNGLHVSHDLRQGISKSVKDFLASIENLLAIHNRLSNVIFHNMDALKLIRKYFRNPNVFFYLDPPYHHSKRGDKRYNFDFTNEQHQELVRLVTSPDARAKFLISGYDCEEYKNLV